MDYPSSFSLVITQLDSNEKDITLGLVTGTFDEQDPKFAENRSKHRNDPVTMKKLRDKAVSKSKKFSSKSSKKKFDDSVRPRLPKDNKDELHVWVQGKILKFTMLEFAIITGLKCAGNIDDYMYTSSSKSELKSKYFSDNKGAITRSKLITRMKMKKFDNAEDALNLHSYKNIQPTTEEVRRLDLSFSTDFETFDPTTSASTSVAGMPKRTTDEFQQRVGTIAEEFSDFSTIPP
ncbi:hypothetical protein BC332_02145 [Capsicum chinense]|nr:hypothetical protein BC332_02145 [Capsicum chinense]